MLTFFCYKSQTPPLSLPIYLVTCSALFMVQLCVQIEMCEVQARYFVWLCRCIVHPRSDIIEYEKKKKKKKKKTRWIN